MDDPQESRNIRNLLEELPIDIPKFSGHPDKIEGLALLISPVATPSYEQRCIEAATTDLITSVLSFMCEYGGPKELHLGTAYYLCELVSANDESALDLMFKQVEEGVSYDKERHAWRRDYCRTPTPNGFSSQRYRSLKRHTSPRQRLDAARHAMSLLSEIATVSPSTFFVEALKLESSINAGAEQVYTHRREGPE